MASPTAYLADLTERPERAVALPPSLRRALEGTEQGRAVEVLSARREAARAEVRRLQAAAEGADVADEAAARKAALAGRKLPAPTGPKIAEALAAARREADVVERAQAVAGREALEAGRSLATALAADLVGQAEAHEEEAIALLGEAVEAARRAGPCRFEAGWLLRLAEVGPTKDPSPWIASDDLTGVGLVLVEAEARVAEERGRSVERRRDAAHEAEIVEQDARRARAFPPPAARAFTPGD